MAVSFCPKCGAGRVPGSRFCGSCGADLDAMAAASAADASLPPASVSPASPQDAASTGETPPARGGHRLRRNLVAVAVLGLCAAVVIVVALVATPGVAAPGTARPGRTYQDVFSPTGVPKACLGCTLTALPGGQVLLAGALVQGRAFTAGGQLWDPQTGSWTPTGSMSERRTNHAAVLLKTGKVLVAGGGGADATGKPLRYLASSERKHSVIP